MKISTKVTTCIMALGIALSVGACSTVSPEATPSTSASATPSAVASASEQAKVATRFEQFLQAAYTVDEEKMKDFYAKYEQVSSEPTDEEKTAIISSMVEVLPELEYIDVEGLTLDEIGSVYGTALSSSTLQNTSSIVIKVPEEAVTINGETASVDTSKLEITIDDVAATPTATVEPIVTFTLKNDTWMIDHEELTIG